MAKKLNSGLFSRALLLFLFALCFFAISNQESSAVPDEQKPEIKLTSSETAEYSAEELREIAELKKKIAAFDDALFGERTPMGDALDKFEDPAVYPTKGQHPRLNLTADMIPDIKALLEDPDYADLALEFWRNASTPETGIRPDVSTLSKTYNWDGNVVARIEAKALAYLLTGNELYGYQAIYAAKNHMLTLTLSHDLFSDLLRPYGWSMMVTGEVYDWCYDLMTETDKSQFVRGAQKYYCEDRPCGQHDKIKVGFPPTDGAYVQGHGTNTAIMRDYLAFSIAIYDEYPDWYELIGGRINQQYAAANNVFYAAGITHQGTNNYVWGKFYAQLYSAWLIKTMSGVLPYDPRMEDVVYGLMGMRLPNELYFQSGDSPSKTTGATGNFKADIYIAQALFPSA